MNSNQKSLLLLCICLVTAAVRRSDAYAVGPRTSNNRLREPVAQKKLKTVGAEQERGKNWKLSHSILASCDTLPSFPTAHGILSPETVSRMDEMTSGGHGNKAVSIFLETYRKQGPMSCLEMLSDPEVLPHLTKAMREII